MSQEQKVGFVDTHLHLLPGLDDGPDAMETTLEMAELMIADGTTHAAVTHHANYQFSFDPARVRELCVQVQQQVGPRLQIMPGCEVHLTYENVQAALGRPLDFTLNESKYLLVEFPEFFEQNAMEGALQQLRSAGLTPILAHPERNPVFQQHLDVLVRYLKLGCASQVTASSFTGRFGKRAQQMAKELLDQELIHVVASDGHSPRQRSPRLSEAAQVIAELAGEEVAHALTSANPWAIIHDEPLAYYPRIAREKKKSFWAFLRS